MVRIRHSPVSRVSTINCVLMYFSRITFVVLCARNDPGRVTAIERHSQWATLGLDLALEVDVGWQMVGFVFGPGFDFPRLHEHGVGRDEAHRCGCVAGGDCPVEGVDDCLDVTLAGRWRRWRCARRQPRQKEGQ